MRWGCDVTVTGRNMYYAQTIGRVDYIGRLRQRTCYVQYTLCVDYYYGKTKIVLLDERASERVGGWNIGYGVIHLVFGLERKGKKERKKTHDKNEKGGVSDIGDETTRLSSHCAHNTFIYLYYSNRYILHCKLSRFFSQGIICYTVVHIVCDRRTNIEWLLMNTTTWPVLTRKYEQVTTKSEERNSKESEKNAYTSTIRFDE